MGLYYIREYHGLTPDDSGHCGTVKVSSQSGWMTNSQTTVTVSVKGLYSCEVPRIYVGAVFISDRRQSTQELGRMNLSNGFGKAEFDLESSINEAVGIVLSSDGTEIMAAAMFDEMSPLLSNSLNTDAPVLEENKATEQTAAEVKAADTTWTGPSARAEQETAIVSDNTAEEEKQTVSEDSHLPEPIQTETEHENVSIQTEEAIVEAATEQKIEASTVSSVQETITVQERPKRRLQRDIFRGVEGRRVNVFEDDLFYDCMEVTPEQLQQITKENVMQNSFLMHGYYNYHHLLIARVADEPGRLFVGVPGIYTNKERFIAGMFDFNEFKRSHRSDYRNPYFGYWYRY